MCYNRQLQALQTGQAGQKRQGAGTICNGGLGCTELAVGDDNIVESLRVRIKGQNSKADVPVPDHPARMTTLMNYSLMTPLDQPPLSL